MAKKVIKPTPKVAAKSSKQPPSSSAKATVKPSVSIAKAAPSASVSRPSGTSMLAKQGRVTQVYGQPSQYDVFSKNISPAHEVAVPVGTKLAAPAGQWKVVTAFGGANRQGRIGNFEGQGWGNHVRLQNTQTGEVIGLNHMDTVAVQPGQTIQGGESVGTSGTSGNSTGPHVAITYRDAAGNVGDFAKSPYMRYLYGGIPVNQNAQVPIQPSLTPNYDSLMRSTPRTPIPTTQPTSSPDVVPLPPTYAQQPNQEFLSMSPSIAPDQPSETKEAKKQSGGYFPWWSKTGYGV